MRFQISFAHASYSNVCKFNKLVYNLITFEYVVSLSGASVFGNLHCFGKYEQLVCFDRV